MPFQTRPTSPGTCTWRRFASATCLAMALFGQTPVASAATAVLASKLSPDLSAVMTSGVAAAGTTWALGSGSSMMMQLLVVANGVDPEMVALRAAVVANGGSVFMRYASVSALSVLLPMSSIHAVAARADVTTISPNRATARTASLLESTTGTLGTSISAGSPRLLTRSTVTGLDGSGVGIAVLDSGIASTHAALLSVDGTKSRVTRAVNLLNYNSLTNLASNFLGSGATTASAGTTGWTAGVDVSDAMAPNGLIRIAYEAAITTTNLNSAHDVYGHGSHVASVAAGRGGFRTPDATGIAPNANLFDVKVLNDAGGGKMSDALAGIDWVLFHAREYNIRVLNLSLAANSTESFLTDPLCRAVRAASAAGITVVAAAGNFGKNLAGAEVYGSVGAPGNDPSVITVGSANPKATAVRTDDLVNGFSSRGPTRGGCPNRRRERGVRV